MSNAIVKFDFKGDALDVVQLDGGDIAIPLRRLCEVLGVDVDGQAKKLRASPWATTVIMPVVADDGKVRDALCLHRRSIALWAASINANKVAPEKREKLIAYQIECADILADHFLGRRGATAVTALAAAETLAQQAGLVRDDAVLMGRLELAIRRACRATKRTWAAIEAMIRRSTPAPGWTMIAAINAQRAIDLLEAVEAGHVAVPRKPKKRSRKTTLRLLGAPGQTVIPFPNQSIR